MKLNSHSPLVHAAEPTEGISAISSTILQLITIVYILCKHWSSGAITASEHEGLVSQFTAHSNYCVKTNHLPAPKVQRSLQLFFSEHAQ